MYFKSKQNAIEFQIRSKLTLLCPAGQAEYVLLSNVTNLWIMGNNDTELLFI